MISIVRKTLEVYLREKRIITQTDLTSEELTSANMRDAIFVTLYYEGKVIASVGRIQAQKSDTLAECIDITLLTLKDPRFAENLQTAELLPSVKVRVDRISPTSRRMIKNIADLNVRSEGLILLSQTYGAMAVILPGMITGNPDPEQYFEIACKKA